jgi:hypothetical protein
MNHAPTRLADRGSLLLLPALVAVLGLSGCGGGDGAEEAEPVVPVTVPEVEPTEDVPPPLTAEQVAEMSREEATEWLTKISAARSRATDPELRARLKSDFDMLMDHVRGGARRSSTAPIPPPEIPPPLTEEQLATMTRAEALELLAKVSRARRHAQEIDDDELAERLLSDQEKLMELARKPDQ